VRSERTSALKVRAVREAISSTDSEGKEREGETERERERD
jgi:hypothetical protein